MSERCRANVVVRSSRGSVVKDAPLEQRENSQCMRRAVVDGLCRQHAEACRAMLDAREDEPCCRDCADENGICPHDGSPCDRDDVSPRCNEDTHYWPSHAPGNGPRAGTPCKCGWSLWPDCAQA